jgi:hypothetical protein
MNTLIVIIEALLINAWADDGSYIRGSWPTWVGSRLLPLCCVAVFLAVVFWARESRASRVMFRAAVVTVLACLINVLPFVWNDPDHYRDAQHTELESPAIATKAPTLINSVLAFFEPTDSSEQAEQQMQSRYLTALSRCIEQKSKQPLSSYNAAKSECTADATKIGHRAFILRYWVK